jgi:hypothetical protein
MGATLLLKGKMSDMQLLQQQQAPAALIDCCWWATFTTVAQAMPGCVRVRLLMQTMKH